MQLRDAINLVKSAPVDNIHPTIWADLGCGSGLFTRALASLLGERSTIYAVDSVAQTLPAFFRPSLDIRFVEMDFEKETLDMPPLHGILMANSLHYIKDKTALLEKLKTALTGDGQFIVVEYDTMMANPYVPYPIDWAHLTTRFGEAGFAHVTRLGERPSTFGRSNLYAASVRRAPVADS